MSDDSTDRSAVINIQSIHFDSFSDGLYIVKLMANAECRLSADAHSRYLVIEMGKLVRRGGKEWIT
jgi:hypothetical protein